MIALSEYNMDIGLDSYLALMNFEAVWVAYTSYLHHCDWSTVCHVIAVRLGVIVRKPVCLVLVYWCPWRQRYFHEFGGLRHLILTVWMG